MLDAEPNVDLKASDSHDACAHRLRSIVCKLDAFMDEQLERVDAMARYYEDAQRRELATQQMHEALAADKQVWEQQRTEQIEELRQEAELLRDAWARHEREQRRVLAQEANKDAATMESNGDLRQASVYGQSAAHPQENANVAATNPIDDVVRQTAVHQFLQLGHEIGRHVRRKF